MGGLALCPPREQAPLQHETIGELKVESRRPGADQARAPNLQPELKNRAAAGRGWERAGDREGIGIVIRDEESRAGQPATKPRQLSEPSRPTAGAVESA